MFHPFLTVQAGAPRHCLSIALALLAITSNITNYYYTRPPFRCAARACADAVLPAALHCSLLCISELCLRPNPCGIECTDCTAQYTLPEMGGSIEPPEPPLATGLVCTLVLFISIDFNVNTPTDLDAKNNYTPDVDVTGNYDITMTLPHSRLLTLCTRY